MNNLPQFTPFHVFVKGRRYFYGYGPLSRTPVDSSSSSWTPIIHLPALHQGSRLRVVLIVRTSSLIIGRWDRHRVGQEGFVEGGVVPDTLQDNALHVKRTFFVEALQISSCCRVLLANNSHFRQSFCRLPIRLSLV